MSSDIEKPETKKIIGGVVKGYSFIVFLKGLKHLKSIVLLNDDFLCFGQWRDNIATHWHGGGLTGQMTESTGLVTWDDVTKIQTLSTISSQI